MNEISKNLMCVSMRDGVNLWVEEEKLEALMGAMETKRFIKIDKNVINVADITGIYEAKEVADRTRRKNGEWQDNDGVWHKKGERVCCKGNVVPFGMKCGYCSI